MKSLTILILLSLNLTASTQSPDTALLRNLKTIKWPKAYCESDTGYVYLLRPHRVSHGRHTGPIFVNR